MPRCRAANPWLSISDARGTRAINRRFFWTGSFDSGGRRLPRRRSNAWYLQCAPQPLATLAASVRSLRVAIRCGSRAAAARLTPRHCAWRFALSASAFHLHRIR